MTFSISPTPHLIEHVCELDHTVYDSQRHLLGRTPMLSCFFVAQPKRNSNHFHALVGCWLTAGIAGLTGFGCSAAPQAASVDAHKARESLHVVLESWKNGSKPEDLVSRSPSITAQDLDWLSGVSLVDYKVESEGRNDDANLRIPVELTLRDVSGLEVRKRVSYVVGTHPSITVFREL